MSRKELAAGDVAAMREAARWWREEGSDEYPDDAEESLEGLAREIEAVARRIEAALADGDQEAAQEALGMWPAEAGSWY